MIRGTAEFDITLNRIDILDADITTGVSNLTLNTYYCFIQNNTLCFSVGFSNSAQWTSNNRISNFIIINIPDSYKVLTRRGNSYSVCCSVFGDAGTGISGVQASCSVYGTNPVTLQLYPASNMTRGTVSGMIPLEKI